MTELAVLFFEGKGVTKNVEAGFTWMEKAARTGDRSAMVMLARYYYEGIMVKAPDYTKAMYWFKQLVDVHSHVSSMLYIGEMYQDGKGVAKDNSEAFNWYKKGADKGSRDGMNAVGACYLKGTGVAQDYAKASEWFKKSADRNFFQKACTTWLICTKTGMAPLKTFPMPLPGTKKQPKKVMIRNRPLNGCSI